LSCLTLRYTKDDIALYHLWLHYTQRQLIIMHNNFMIFKQKKIELGWLWRKKVLQSTYIVSHFLLSSVVGSSCVAFHRCLCFYVCLYVSVCCTLCVFN